MCKVGPSVLKHFKQRESDILELIKQSGIEYREIGVFGSYARGDFKATSDIDFCIITENRPSLAVSGGLRGDAEILGADIIYVTPKYFETDASPFAKNLRKDYRRLL